MKKKFLLNTIFGITILIVLLTLSKRIFIEPWIAKKIQEELNEDNKGYSVEIGNLHVAMVTSELELESISISSNQSGSNLKLEGEIASIKLKGINLWKALVRKEIDIREITSSGIYIKGLFSGETTQPKVSPLNIRIGTIFFDEINLELKDILSAKAYSVKQGVLKLYDLEIDKKDTISSGHIPKFDFEASELISVSADSIYSLKAFGIDYLTTSSILAVDSFYVHPNYGDYEFTSHYQFQTDCIKVAMGKIHVSDFSVEAFLQYGNLVSSYVEIEDMEVNAFRDMREEFRHVDKPAFQDHIYSYPGRIHVDSINLTNGKVTYTEHAEKANEPGTISFDDINVKVFKLSNDTIYKSKVDFLIIKGEALLMGKSRMTVLLRGRIYDSMNTFSLDGTLYAMEAKELNPIMEKNAFVYATSGKIDAVHFSFTADNTRATGKMNLLYHELDLAVKNKQTDDTTAFKERFISFIVNKKVMDANPLSGEIAREGTINYERDTEKFVLNYCFNSILSGIKSSLVKSPKEKKIS